MRIRGGSRFVLLAAIITESLRQAVRAIFVGCSARDTSSNLPARRWPCWKPQRSAYSYHTWCGVADYYYGPSFGFGFRGGEPAWLRDWREARVSRATLLGRP